MSQPPPNPVEVSPPAASPSPAPAERQLLVTSPRPESQPVAGQMPPKQLSEMPKEELEYLAEELGLDPTQYKTPQHLVAAIHERRQLIATLNREAMLDVIRWSR